MKAKTIIRLEFPSEKQLQIVLRALKPEVEKPGTMRTKASFERNGSFLVLKVEAKDTVALRAGLNAYLRWINSMMNVLKTLETL
jgi:KEOPS complex subunit Pcc1